MQYLYLASYVVGSSKVERQVVALKKRERYPSIHPHGAIALMGERLACTEEVVSSTLTGSTIYVILV